MEKLLSSKGRDPIIVYTDAIIMHTEEIQILHTYFAWKFQNRYLSSLFVGLLHIYTIFWSFDMLDVNPIAWKWISLYLESQVNLFWFQYFQGISEISSLFYFEKGFIHCQDYHKLSKSTRKTNSLSRHLISDIRTFENIYQIVALKWIMRCWKCVWLNLTFLIWKNKQIPIGAIIWLIFSKFFMSEMKNGAMQSRLPWMNVVLK